MTTEQYFKNLEVPDHPIDVVLDTDAYNEIDDQFAIAYLLKNQDKLRIKGFCAAPFFNSLSSSPKDGMEKSYLEIAKLLDLAGEGELKQKVYRGSESYLPNEKTPVESEAADFLASLSRQYSPENPLYIVAIGAITNVASAFLKYPEMKERTVVVWLGGHALHADHTNEFNMKQDIAAARILFACGVPFVQLPCAGVVDCFYTTRYELEHWLCDKNPLADYLARNTIAAAESYAAGKPWSRVIWDVTAIAWLLNDGNRFMSSRLIPSPVPEYDKRYGFAPERHLIRYVHHINRDGLMTDLFEKLTAAN